jgi:zinc protease
MTIISMLPILAMAGTMTPPGSTPGASGFKLPPSLSRTLDNGVHIHVMEFHGLPLVNCNVIVRAGAAHDPKGKEGLADMTATLLRKGTTSRSAMEIASETDLLGAILNATADPDATQVKSEFLARDADAALGLLTDVLFHPAFAPDELERLRGEKLGALQAVRDDPAALAGRKFIELLYAKHPYGHPITGWEATVGSITHEDVTAFYARHYVPSRMIVVAVGDFEGPRMLDKLAGLFSALPSTGAGDQQPIAEPAAPAARAVYLVDKPESTQSQIRIGGIGISRRDPDYIPLVVANTILGGGFTSRLVEEIRVNRGLSYGVSSRLLPQVQPGPFVISTFTKNATTLEIIKVALAELEKFRRDGATAAELAKARGYLKGAFAIHNQTGSALANALADIAFYDLPADYYDVYLDRIMAVTLEDIARVAQRLPFEKLQIVVLGEAKVVRSDVATLGSVKDVPLEPLPPSR